jgi:hypothetical protein
LLLLLLSSHLQQEEGYACCLQAWCQLLQALQHEHKLTRTSTKERRHLAEGAVQCKWQVAS